MSGGAPARGGGTARRATRAPQQKAKPAATATGAGAQADEAQAILLLHDRLRQRYGTPVAKSHQAPLDELVFTILSQNTTDTNRDRAWASLWKHFDSWEEVAGAPAEEIAAAIKIGGLHKIKAQRIKEILGQIERERGGLDLGDLVDLDIDAARRELGRYKGVGAKSVNCILLFSLGLPAFPVDTHVHRILRRLGVIETKDLGKANRDVQELVADDIAYPLHMNVIRYGREVCHARRPKCWDCNIEDLCAYEDKNLEDR